MIKITGKVSRFSGYLLYQKPGLEVPKKGFSGKIDLFVLYYNSHEIRTVLKCACLYGISKALGSSSCSLFSNAVYLNLFMVLEM
jgi:hypothetical protein